MKSTKSDRTELVFIVDRSGSMAGMESDTVGGLNSVLKRNRKAKGECDVSIVLFDNASEVLVDRKPIAEVRKLKKGDYRVGGCTALLDAVGDAVTYTSKIQGYLPEGHKASNVLFCIITDGQENASNHRTYEEVKSLIEARREDGWEFLFLGANIDAAAEAARMGIPETHASKYVSDAAGSTVAYEAFADASVGMRACGAVPKAWNFAPSADAARRG